MAGVATAYPCPSPLPPLVRLRPGLEQGPAERGIDAVTAQLVKQLKERQPTMGAPEPLWLSGRVGE
jgi:hypothetical protein